MWGRWPSWPKKPAFWQIVHSPIAIAGAWFGQKVENHAHSCGDHWRGIIGAVAAASVFLVADHDDAASPVPRTMNAGCKMRVGALGNKPHCAHCWRQTTGLCPVSVSGLRLVCVWHASGIRPDICAIFSCAKGRSADPPFSAVGSFCTGAKLAVVSDFSGRSVSTNGAAEREPKAPSAHWPAGLGFCRSGNLRAR